MAVSIDLENLPAEELQSIYDRAGELLAVRKKQRQQSVIEEAKAKLAEVGLSLRDLTRLAATKRTAKTRSRTAGEAQTLTNPADPTQTWRPGRGRPPKWVKNAQAAKP